MPDFRYKARNTAGKIENGGISAPSREMVKTLLARKRMTIISLQEVQLDKSGKDISGISLFGGRLRFDSKGNIIIGGADKFVVPDRELVIMTKQLGTMLSSGIPLNQSLDILSRQQRLPRFGEVLAGVRQGIEEGSNFSTALSRYPGCFDTLYCSMVKAGEESGRLADITAKLLTYIEKSSKIKSQLKSASVYPTLVVIVAISVITGLLAFVVPSMTRQFVEAGKELPWLTQQVVNMSDFLVNNWDKIIGTIVVAFIALKRYIATPKGRYQFDNFIFKIPVIGDVIKKISVGRFCSTMSSMLTSGVNILQALTICASSSGNLVMEQFILSCRARIEKGQQLSIPLSENPLFPKMVVSMIQIGEQTGKTDEMLQKISAFYEEEVDNAVKTMLGMIEPLMIVVIGSIVGILVIAMYLPMLDMGSVIG